MPEMTSDTAETSRAPIRVFVAGHRGMVGAAIVRRLSADARFEILTAPRDELDLADPSATRAWLAEQRPEQIYLAAARVGGIHANATYPADFIHDNLAIQTSVIQAAHALGIDKLLFLGSSCIYPRLAEQPIREEALLGGPLEPTNEPYAIAKIAGIKLCESINRQHGRDYRSVMPTNLYGPGDNFHPRNSHVVPALIQRFHDAKRRGDDVVEVWGSGAPRREFLHVDDMAAACVHVMNLERHVIDQVVSPTCSHLNVGTGTDLAVATLAQTIAGVVGFAGEIHWDTSKPDGAPRKLLDVSRLQTLGWRATIDLEAGLADTYCWFAANETRLRR